MSAPSRRFLPTALLWAAALGAVLPGAGATPVSAQIRRNPTGVNVNPVGPTTVFVTYGDLDGYVPAEALWCGELVPASPDLGERCDPATIFGALPVRLDRSRPSGDDAFSDVMSIPASVARRAYQAAAAGAESSFFYVRRFVDPAGARPDQFVVVTCRMASDGARTPLALVDVRLRFAGDEPVPGVAPGSTPPAAEAFIAYNGTGRLVGRWEVVLPGEEPPTGDDLLTEATLPLELRGTQRRWTELERFNVFLPPTGEVVVPGPGRLPTELVGLHQLLLRIEVSDDKEGDVDLAAAGAGTGTLPTGAVAGFRLPVLRYFVGDAPPAAASGDRLQLLAPVPGAVHAAGAPLVLSWSPVAAVVLYRVRVREAGGGELLAAMTQAGVASYAVPPFVVDEARGRRLEWRVEGLDASGEVVAETPWSPLGISG